MIDGLSNLAGMFAKLTPAPLIGFSIASSVVLFAPPSFAETFGMFDFRDKYRFAIGAVWIASVSSLFAHLIWWSRGNLIRWYDIQKRHNAVVAHLKTLTPDEKGYLIRFVQEKRASVNFGADDGIVHSLAAKGILFRLGTVGTYVRGTPYGMDPWVRKHLNAHKQLLEGALQARDYHW